MDLKNLATRIVFGSIKYHDVNSYGWMLRKGKTEIDINHAIIKAGSNCGGKLEYNITLLTSYLTKILKKTPELKKPVC